MAHTIIVRTLIALVWLSAVCAAEIPDWVKSQGRSSRHPDQLYLTGYGMDKPGKGEGQAVSLQRAQDFARSYLIQRIRVRIQSTIGSSAEERDQKVSTLVSSAVVATSSMEIQGLNVETYWDSDDEIAHALAYVSREKLVQLYKEKQVRLRNEIQGHLNAGKAFENSGERTRALAEYIACYPLFQQLEEARAILAVSGSESMRAFQELEGEVEQDQVGVEVVRDAVQRLLQRPLRTPDDLTWYLAYCLNEQANLKNVSVLVAPPTYRDTKMGSPFSRYFKQILEHKLQEVARWNPVQQAGFNEPRTRDLRREGAQAAGAEYILRGTYWEEDRAVRFVAALSRVSDGKTIASAETIVSDSVVGSTKLSIKPQNFESAFSDQKQFSVDEVVGAGLSLEVWTNKGTEDLIFTKGERMQAYVRVNMPCYIRFVYHLADGRRALLVDNYYIDQSKVNVVYPIPGEFECDEPFGAEFLQGFARTDPFEAVQTEKVGGYDILKDGLKGFLSQQRGMKRVNQKTLQAETRVVMTTMEK